MKYCALHNVKLSVSLTPAGTSRCEALLHAPKVYLSCRKAHLVQKKNLCLGRQRFFFVGGDNRTRTCDLMRVKQRRDFRPVWEGHFSTKTLENTGLLAVCLGRPLFFFSVLTSCLPAAKSIARRLFTIQALYLKLYTSIYIPPHIRTSGNIFLHLRMTTSNLTDKRRKKKVKKFLKTNNLSHHLG